MIENVGDHGPEVEQDPLALRQPFNMEGLHLTLLHLIHQVHGNGFNVAITIPVTDQKIVRDAGVLGYIQKDRILGLFVFGQRFK